MVREASDGDLILDVDSVVANGQRYALDTTAERLDSGNNIIGSIVGTLSGGEIRGPAVRVPRDSVVTFRLDRPLTIGVADRGVNRSGFRWHDWEQ